MLMHKNNYKEQYLNLLRRNDNVVALFVKIMGQEEK